MAEETKAAFGHLDIFFANAGAAAATPLGSTDEAAYTRLMDINVKGVFFSVQAVLPLMGKGELDHPQFLVARSAAASPDAESSVGLQGSGVRSFARTFAAELAPKGIRVNAVSPGSIVTPLHHNGRSEADFDAYAEATTKIIPAGRMGQQKDIANAVLFLSSDKSSYVLGAEIIVDGGRAELWETPDTRRHKQSHSANRRTRTPVTLKRICR